MAAAFGATVTVCVTVAGAGSGGCGKMGSADAVVVPAIPITPAAAAATPPARTRQRRAFSIIDSDLLSVARGSSHPRSGADCIDRGELVTRAGTHLGPSSDRAVMEPRPSRGRRSAEIGAYTLFT